MSYTLNVATTFKVSFNDSPQRFNWQSVQIIDFFRLMSIYIMANNDDEYPCSFNVYKDEMKGAIHDLTDVKDGKLDGNEEQKDWVEEINSSLENMGLSIEEMITILKEYLEKGDKEIDYLHFMFF